MSKKFIVGAIIALVLILGGGAGYYVYNRASADAYTKDFCNGIQGQTWRNCVQNMANWKAYMQRVDSARFKQMVNNADKLRNFKPNATAGTGIDTTTGTTGTTGTTTAPVVQPVTGCAGAIFYVDFDFKGASACLTEGDYTQVSMVAKNIPNDSVSSIKVEPGYLARFYFGGGFDGRQMGANSDVKNIGHIWDNEISSIKITKDTSVVSVYMNANYGGDENAFFGVGDFNADALRAQGVGANVINSIKIKPGYSVIAYDGLNFEGSKYEMTSDTPQTELRNGIDSLKVIKTPGTVAAAGTTTPVTGCAGVTIYQNANFSGDKTCLIAGDYPSPTVFAPIGNDQISSIKVEPGYSATVYDDGNFGGPTLVTATDINNLSDKQVSYNPVFGNWDGIISSIKVVKTS